MTRRLATLSAYPSRLGHLAERAGDHHRQRHSGPPDQIGKLPAVIEEGILRCADVRSGARATPMGRPKPANTAA
jgi:hypothetical protein